MGKKNLESLPRKPLSGRKNIVITDEPGECFENAIAAYSIKDAMSKCEKDQEVFIIGGGVFTDNSCSWPAGYILLMYIKRLLQIYISPGLTVEHGKSLKKRNMPISGMECLHIPILYIKERFQPDNEAAEKQ